MHQCPTCGSQSTRQSRSQPAHYEDLYDREGQIIVTYRVVARTCKTCRVDYYVRQTKTSEGWDGDTYTDEEEYIASSPDYSKAYVGVFVGEYTKRISRGVQIRETRMDRLRQYSPN